MNDATKALKKANGDLDVDKVHGMIDDTTEQQDEGKEISEAISNPMAFGHGGQLDEEYEAKLAKEISENPAAFGLEFDEDELEAELNAL